MTTPLIRSSTIGVTARTARKGRYFALIRVKLLSERSLAAQEACIEGFEPKVLESFRIHLHTSETLLNGKNAHLDTTWNEGCIRIDKSLKCRPFEPRPHIHNFLVSTDQ